MISLLGLVCVFVCVVAAALPVGAQGKTLLFTSRYDSESLDAAAGLLGKARPFDVFAVTPGAGATAFVYLPAAGTSAMTGDPDNDGVVAEFTGQPHNTTGFGGMFVKHADRKSTDPGVIYRTVIQTAPPSMTIVGFDGTNIHAIRPGDFVRWKPNGDLEFFIRQEHIMTAAGPQSVGISGAADLCQTAGGDLIYAPARDLNGQGGHHVNNPTSRIWCNDGSFVLIPAAAITYDADGNVSAVTANSAVQLAEEVAFGPSGQPSVRSMCQNSGAVDSIGKQTSVTFTLVGLDVDPNGGTWTGNYGHTVPNLIFTFNNTATTCCGGPFGSWHGTVFSTVKNSTGSMGSVARINGVAMGATSGNADGAWSGLKQGSGNADAPILRGLAWIDTGLLSTKPYGNVAIQAVNDGTIDAASGLDLAVQGAVGGFPLTLAVSLGTGKGARPAAIPFGSLWDGFGSVYVRSPIIATLPLVPPAGGQLPIKDQLPNDPRLKGLNFVWQVVGITFGRPKLSNPVITEVR